MIFFQVGLENSLCKYVNMNTNLKQKVSLVVISTISHLVPYPNNFLAVCICVLIFHGIYSTPTPPTNISFMGANFFLSCSKGLGKFQISWGPLVLGGPNFLFGRKVFFSLKPSMANHVNLRKVNGKLICFMCVCQLFSLLLGNFQFENFLFVQVSIQTLKKVFTVVC